MNARELFELTNDLPKGVLPEWFTYDHQRDYFRVWGQGITLDAAMMIVAEACSDHITRSGYMLIVDPIGDGEYRLQLVGSSGCKVFGACGARLSLLVAACKAVG